MTNRENCTNCIGRCGYRSQTEADNLSLGGLRSRNLESSANSRKETGGYKLSVQATVAVLVNFRLDYLAAETGRAPSDL